MATEDKKTTSILTCKVLAVFFVGTYLLRFIFSAVYFKQIGLSSTFTGILQGASPIASAIGGIIFGYISDRADLRKTIFICSYFAYAATPFLITLPQPYYHCIEPSNTNLTNSYTLINQSFENGTQLKAFHHLITIEGGPKITDILKDAFSIPEKEFPTEIESPNESKRHKVKLFGTELIIIIFGDFLAGASINLADSLLVGAVDDKKQYGKLRLWGNIGQSVTIPSIAVITYFMTVDICGVPVSDFKYALYSASLISSIGLIFSVFNAHFPSSKLNEDSKNCKGRGSLKELITPLETWSFLIIAFFYGAFNGTVTSFLFWKMVDLNPSQANLAIAVANFVRNAAGLATYLLAPKILHAVGYRCTLSISCLIYASSFVVIAVMRSTWLSALAELIVGSGQALSMAACVSYIGEIAHPSLAVTAQGKYAYNNMYRLHCRNTEEHGRPRRGGGRWYFVKLLYTPLDSTPGTLR